MNQDLGFHPPFLVWALESFLRGYFLFEVPSNLILHKVGARIWIATRHDYTGDSSLAAWLLCRGTTSFYILRFLLGVAEAGFFPGIILLSQLLVSCRQACAGHCHLYGRSSLSTALGSRRFRPHCWRCMASLGCAGWQWMFVLEALPALVLGVVVLFFLTDRPAKAKWLTDQERAWLGKRHAQDEERARAAKTEPFQRMARASGYTRPGAGAGLFRYLSRAVYAWHLVPRKSFAVSVLPRWRLVS